jgi:alpha-1,2-glucosyltransferase
VSELRTLNTAAIFAIFHLSLRCRFELEAQRSTSRALSTYAVHTAVNVALFPVLFFFSGLYYTDVASTAAVLLALEHQLRRIRLRREGEIVGLLSDAWIVVLGVAALLMRQTNVFWVVVLNGGLEAVDAVKGIKMPRPAAKNGHVSVMERVWQTLGQYAAGHIHDPLLSAAWLDDVVYTIISIALTTVCNPLPVLRRVWPHVTLLGLFGSFVIWNGGVVLGDKSNHIATIHLPQMLYIWPFFAFFLAPLLIPAVLRLAKHPLDVLGLTSVAIPAPYFPAESEKAPNTTKLPRPRSKALDIMTRISYTKDFRPFAAVGTIILFSLVVHFNTIVHPFTLADNRHYMFYIFRHTIRRSETVRLALAVPYALCLLLSWTALCRPTSEHGAKICQCRFVNHPFLPASQPCPSAQEPDKVHPNRSTAVVAYLDARESRAAEPVAVSTVLLVILASGLSLVTAPLVEPRYFIIPWVMWRLLVPAWQPSKTPETATDTPPQPKSHSAWIHTPLSRAYAIAQKHDVRLFAETAWFLAINLVTMYIFVAWPYTWRAEDGTLLDNGRVQHFMW